jgi:hypothetical protein
MSVHPIPTAHERKFFNPWEDYEIFVKETAIFPDDLGVIYCAGKLNGETGELAGKVVEWTRYNGGFTDYAFKSTTSDRRTALLREAGDILWYMTALTREIGANFTTVRSLADSNVVGDKYDQGFDAIQAALDINDLSGKIAEIVFKFMRDQPDKGYTTKSYAADTPTVQHLITTLGELYASLEVFVNTIGSDMPTVRNMNVEKLESRRKRGTLSGSGDNR